MTLEDAVKMIYDVSDREITFSNEEGNTLGESEDRQLKTMGVSQEENLETMTLIKS